MSELNVFIVQKLLFFLKFASDLSHFIYNIIEGPTSDSSIGHIEGPGSNSSDSNVSEEVFVNGNLLSLHFICFSLIQTANFRRTNEIIVRKYWHGLYRRHVVFYCKYFEFLAGRPS